jgi:hypothetical protein
MKARLALVVLASLAFVGCGGEGSPGGAVVPSCFTPQPGVYYLDRNVVFAANAGASSISAFQNPGPTVAAVAVCGSPFRVSAPPTALAGGGAPPGSRIFNLVVLSALAKTISLFSVDYVSSALTGPVATVATPYTPVAAAIWQNYLYVANAEGSVSAYEVAGQTALPTISELPGSPFRSGSARTP